MTPAVKYELVCLCNISVSLLQRSREAMQVPPISFPGSWCSVIVKKLDGDQGSHLAVASQKANPRSNGQKESKWLGKEEYYLVSPPLEHPLLGLAVALQTGRKKTIMPSVWLLHSRTTVDFEASFVVSKDLPISFLWYVCMKSALLQIQLHISMRTNHQPLPII